jgi:hypothetical protein
MGKLSDKLLAPQTRPQVVADCARLVDEEVADKSGLSGLAIKGAYAVVKAVKGGIIPEVLDSLLPSFVEKLEPIYQAWLGGSGSLPEYFGARTSEVADALLSITDERSKRTKNAGLQKAYEKLRPTGKKNVEQAIPRLAQLLAKYAPR